MNERLASGEIYVGLDDEAALTGLRRVEAEFGRTMQRIEHEKATVELRATEDRLKRDLEKAKAEVKKYQAYVKEADTKYTADARKQSLNRVQQQEKEARGALKAHRAIMSAKTDQAREEARSAAAREAIFRREQQRSRILEQAERRRAMQLKQLNDFSARMNKQRASEMSRAHSDALRANRDYDNQALAVARLQRQYSEAHDTLRKLNGENRRFRSRVLRSPGEQQKVDLNIREAEARMVKLEAELKALSARPIHQEVDLDVKDRGINALDRWSKALTDATVRVGPFTTTMAGLSRVLLLLGPILSALVGQASALVAVVGAGAAGAIGVTAGAVGALGVSLGGVAFLLPSMLRDFKGLNTIQKAYHTAVLKFGKDAPKTVVALDSYNHALGAVSPTTRKAFLALNTLQDRWRSLNKEARPTFFHMLGEAITTANHQFTWFHKNTLGAFAQLDKGWSKWMKSLRSGEADQILINLGRNGNRSIQPLMSGFGHLAGAIGRIASSFSNFLPGLFKGFDRWAGSLSDATKDSDRLDKTAHKLVDSMRSIGHFTMAAARVITAFFSPGIDDGTKMVDRWADGLNHLADTMNGRGRAGINNWFKQSVALARQFWGALKPLAQVFFEWTTIMRPFTSVALTVLTILGNMVHAVSAFKPTRAILVSAFGIFLAGALLKRIATAGEGLWTIYKALTAIKTAGGIGAALKGGVIKFLSGGVAGARGSTPATPMYVYTVNGGGAPGRPGGGGSPSPIGGGLLSRLPNFVKISGGILGVAAAFAALTKAADNLSKSHGLDIADKKVQKLVGRRDMQGLMNLKKYMQDFGGNNKPFIAQVDAGIKAIQRLDNQDAHRLTSSINQDFDRMGRKTKVTLQDVSRLANYHFDIIARTTQKGSGAAARASERNFGRAKKAIKQAMHEGTISTKDGLALIEKLWAKSLAAYGFTPKQARAMTQRLPGSKQTPGANGELRPNARGGLYQVGSPGQRAPDSVPMNLGGIPSVVAPGEQIAVFNSHQQRKMAKLHPGGLEGFFSGPQPKHYAQGGMIGAANRLEGAHFPYQWGGGHQASPAPFGPVDCSGAVSFVLQNGGINIPTMTSGQLMNVGKPGPGPVTVFANPEHTFMRIGARYFGTSESNPGGGAGWFPEPSAQYLARFTQRHFDAGDIGSGIGESIAAPLITGLGGALGAVANATMTTATAAANANLANLSTAVLGGGDSQLPPSGAFSKAMLMSLWQSVGGPGGFVARVAAAIALAESGGDPNASNGPYHGLWQVGPGGSFDPTMNAAEAVGKYKAAGNRFTPWTTYTGYDTPGHEKTYLRYMAEGGIATMPEKQWARGGRIEQPTLMTGEDKGKHPEFVVGTNPIYRSSNLDALRAAASALGVGQARKSHKHRTHHKHHPSAQSRRINNAPIPRADVHGGDVSKLKWVKRYGELQGMEEDTNRQISIENSKVKEPDTFIKKTGTDDAGNDLYAIDESAISTYWTQLNAVKKLYDTLVGKGGILDKMVEAASKAYTQIALYIAARQDNIGVLDRAINRDKRLARHSKDKDTVDAANKRIQNEQTLRDNERDRIGKARDARADIINDSHDRSFRRQEYNVDFADLVATMAAIRGNATDEAAGANPQPDTTGATGGDAGPSILEQVATFSTARQELYASMGANYANVTQGIGRLGGVGATPVASAGTAVSIGAPSPTGGTTAALQGGNTAAAKGRPQPSGNLRYGGQLFGDTSYPIVYRGADSGGGGTAINVENIIFPVAPTDPHTFSKNLLWELGSMS